MIVPLTTPNVVVAGGGYAGVLAANRLVGLVDKSVDVVLVTPGDTLTDRIRLHEAAARGRRVEHPLETLLHPRVRRLNARVVRVDSEARTVLLEGVDAPRLLHYAALVLALGSRFAETIPGRSEHAFALRDANAARALRKALLNLPSGAEVAVVGGGLTAIELAAELVESHPKRAAIPYAVEVAFVNGAPAVIVRDSERVLVTAIILRITQQTDGAAISAVDVIRNPDKLRALARGARLE